MITEQADLDLTPHQRDGRITVSVLMLTYNHARFIRQAVDSVLAQEAPFRYELVIGDDASTDGTREILNEVAAAHHETIRLHDRRQNVGMHRNFIETLRLCTGEYVALLDGDDYWTSKTKLQRQVETLRHAPQHVMCFHGVDVLVDGAQQGIDRTGEPARSSMDLSDLLPQTPHKSSIDLSDLLRGNLIQPCSLLIRNGILTRLPGWMLSLTLFDWAFTILMAQHGSATYIDDRMAVYRLHPGGVWTSLDLLTRRKQEVRTAEQLYRELSAKFSPTLGAEVRGRWLVLAGQFATGVSNRSVLDERAAALCAELGMRSRAQGTAPVSIREVLAHFYLNAGLEAHTAGNRGLAGYCMLQAACADPRTLANRGLWSVTAQAVLRQ